MSKKTQRRIAVGMLLFAAAFVLYACFHPERSFPWDPGITTGIYHTYLLVMAVFFAAPFRSRKRNET